MTKATLHPDINWFDCSGNECTKLVIAYCGDALVNTLAKLRLSYFRHCTLQQN